MPAMAKKNEAAAALARLRAASLSPRRRREIAKRAAEARWNEEAGGV